MKYEQRMEQTKVFVRLCFPHLGNIAQHCKQRHRLPTHAALSGTDLLRECDQSIFCISRARNPQRAMVHRRGEFWDICGCGRACHRYTCLDTPPLT
jgi:hypothetical protein